MITLGYIGLFIVYYLVNIASGNLKEAVQNKFFIVELSNFFLSSLLLLSFPWISNKTEILMNRCKLIK